MKQGTWRDPELDELTQQSFNAVWDCIKSWDIGIPKDITPSGTQLYSGATGNHVVAILDALRENGCLVDSVIVIEMEEKN